MNSNRHRLKTPPILWMIIVAAALLLSGRSTRADFMDDWPVKVHPHLDLSASYEDNLLISPTNKIGDFSFMISPGLQLLYGNPLHNYLSLDYTLGIEEFYRHTEFNAVNQNVAFTGAYSFSRLKLQVSQIYKDDTSENFEAATRLEEQQNLTSASAEYTLNQYFSIGALYRMEFDHFPNEPGQFDTDLFEPGVALYYHLSPKTDLYGEFDYTSANVVGGQSSQAESASLGVRGKITSKITGNIGVGYENTDYSGTSPSVDTAVASASLHGDFTPHTYADLILSRNVNPSTAFASNSVTSTRVDLTVNEKIYHEKFLVYVGGAYEHDDYNGLVTLSNPPFTPLQRTDDIWEGRVGAKYFVTKWVELGASYRYQRNLSTDHEVSFVDNLVSVDALIHF